MWLLLLPTGHPHGRRLGIVIVGQCTVLTSTLNPAILKLRMAASTSANSAAQLYQSHVSPQGPDRLAEHALLGVPFYSLLITSKAALGATASWLLHAEPSFTGKLDGGSITIFALSIVSRSSQFTSSGPLPET